MQDVAAWIDREVLVEGVGGSLYGSNRQLTGILFYVPRLSFIKVESPALEVPLSALLRFSPGGGSRRRLEAFNAFNHPNFDNKNYGVDVDGPWPWFGDPSRPLSMTKNANWGKFSDTYNSSGGPGSFRVLQLAAKFYF